MTPFPQSAGVGAGVGGVVGEGVTGFVGAAVGAGVGVEPLVHCEVSNSQLLSQYHYN